MNMLLLKLVIINVCVCVAFAVTKIALEVGRCGEDTKIVCSGTDTFTWFIRRNENQIAQKGTSPDTTKYSVRESSTSVVLTIHNTSAIDEGSYYCEVAYDGRSETKDLRLNCSLSFVLSSEILFNETVTLKCSTTLDGYILQINFGVNLVGVYENVFKQITNQDPTKYEVIPEFSNCTTTLTINIRQFTSNDVGTYTCKNTVTSETKDVYLSIADSGLQIEFQRVLGAGTQTITQIQEDSSSTDTFQIMCKVNNVNELDNIGNLRVQYKASTNAQDYTDLAEVQNIKPADTDTYQKPVLASGSLGWEAVGSFDTINSNGRDTTLGVSRPVSTVTCSNAVEYRCQLTYSKPGPSFTQGIDEISKKLDVQVKPTTITRQVYNMSGLSSFPITHFDTIEPFYVGQTVKMECSANIGSYNGTAQIRWLKSNAVAGSPLDPFYSPNAVLGDPESAGNCVYQQTDFATYNMTESDAARSAASRLHFQCYVFIPGINWETPNELRQNFMFIVYSVDVTSVDNSGAVNAGAGSAGIVAGVVAGALAAIVIIVLLVYFLWYRRRSSGDDCNAKNAAIQLNVNPVFETPISPSNEHLTNQEQTEYTEIGIPADGQSSAARYDEDNSSYEHLGSREKSAYTEIGNSSREGPSQYVNQHTDSNATGSSYEVPDNREPPKESRDYENEKDQYEHTPASTYDHVYTAPLEHQYTALDATK